MSNSSSPLRYAMIGVGLFASFYAGSCTVEKQRHASVADRINSAAEHVVQDEAFQTGRTITEPSDRFKGRTEEVPDFQCFGDRLVNARDTYAEDNGVDATDLVLSARGYVTKEASFNPSWDPRKWGGAPEYDGVDQELWDINVNAMEEKGFTPVKDRGQVRTNSNGSHVYKVSDKYNSIDDVLVAANGSADLVDWYEPVSPSQVTDVDGDPVTKPLSEAVRTQDVYLVVDAKPWTSRSHTPYQLPSKSFHRCHDD